MPPTNQEVFNIARSTVISSITKYVRLHMNDTRNFQILDLIIPRERKIRSIVGGLETSLGTTLWEPLARNLARLNGFEVVSQNIMRPTVMPSILQNTLDIIIEGRTSGSVNYNAINSHDRIKDICQDFISTPINNFINAPTGHGVDIWLVKDNINYFFDTKTVQPNVADYSKYLRQVLNWYAYFYSQFPTQNAQARIVFPYNPYGSRDFWNKTVNRGRPLEANNEAWVENQFWDFCSGVENSYQIIHSAFIDISESGDLQNILDSIFE